MFDFKSLLKFVDRKIGICENLMFSSESVVLTKVELVRPSVKVVFNVVDVNDDCGVNFDVDFGLLNTTRNKLITNLKKICIKKNEGIKMSLKYFFLYERAWRSGVHAVNRCEG
jgi:hypothetical protein